MPSDDHGRNAWANQDDATRDRAYACVLAAVELSRPRHGGTATGRNANGRRLLLRLDKNLMT